MRTKDLIRILTLAALWPATASWAQLSAPNEMGVSMGQWHTIVHDIEVTKKFWILMGGKAIKIDGVDVMRFPGVLIFLTAGTFPDGGNTGTVADHVGFGVPNVKGAFAKWIPGGVMKPDVRKSLLNGEMIGYLFTPDGLRLEIEEEAGDWPFQRMPPDLPIKSNHIHFHVAEASAADMQAWYVKTFGAIAGELRQKAGPASNLTGNLPGVEFMYFSKDPAKLAPTKGHALDYIGFEIKNLPAFCKKLEATGIKLDEPYSKTRHKSFASAELTDPWGTWIELTEGLNKF